MEFLSSPVKVKKDHVLLAIVPMPDSPDLDENAVNRLKIGVQYIKDGMGRQGRGYYLSVTGASYDGTFESCMLFQDPSEYILIGSAKRFSAKVFDLAVKEAPEKMKAKIAELVSSARSYYERKGRSDERVVFSVGA